MSDPHEVKSATEAHDIGDERSAYAEPTSEPDEITSPASSLIASIRAALAQGASVELRAAGLNACRSILTVLEAKPGQLLASTPPSAAQTSPASPIASLLSQPGLLSKLAAMSRDELINMFNQITGAMPVRASTPTTAAPRFHLIELPQVRKPAGDR